MGKTITDQGNARNMQNSTARKNELWLVFVFSGGNGESPDEKMWEFRQEREGERKRFWGDLLKLQVSILENWIKT